MGRKGQCCKTTVSDAWLDDIEGTGGACLIVRTTYERNLAVLAAWHREKTPSLHQTREYDKWINGVILCVIIIISISNIFQNGKYCFFLLTVLPNTGVLKLSSSVVFVDCSFCSCSTGRLLRELLGPAVCVATLLSALRFKVTATVLLSVLSFLLLALSCFVFLDFCSLLLLSLSLSLLLTSHTLRLDDWGLAPFGNLCVFVMVKSIRVDVVVVVVVVIVLCCCCDVWWFLCWLARSICFFDLW